MRTMIRNLLCVLTVLSTAAQATEYIEQSYTQKMRSFTKAGGFPDDAKLFGVSFEHLHLNSDWSRGSGTPTGVTDINLALRGVIGFDAKNAYKAEPDEDLKYPAPGNVNPHQGTVMFWVAGLDHNPGDELTNGQKRTNIALSELRFGDGKEHISIKIYEYNSFLAALWSSSAMPEVKGYGAIGLCETKLDFRRGQWYLLAVTWDSETLALFVNGKLRSRSGMPPKIKFTANLKMVREDSFIGVRSKFYDDDHRHAVGIDDFVILNRPLTDIEMGNSYRGLCKGGTDPAQIFNVHFNGVDTGAKTIDKLEAVFDFSGLDNQERSLLNDGKLPVLYTLLSPDRQKISSGALDIRKVSDSYVFGGVDTPGRYELQLQVGDHKGVFSVERPDFSWLGNGIGEEPTIPDSFPDFAVQGRKVQLWNRCYHFGKGPLPERVEYCGNTLLVHPPALSLDKRKIKWSTGKTIQGPTSVTFTGTGRASDCTIDYQTKVEYDGLIDLKFTVHGTPTVSSMTLDWQVRPESAEFLMTPKLKPAGPQAFTFPVSKLDNQLWLVGEGTGGFCWTTENDANWVYGDREKVLFGDTVTGKCQVRMITRQAAIPNGAQYSALFIATPTHPFRTPLRFNAYDIGSKRYPWAITCTGADKSSGAYTGVFNLRPSKYASRFWGKSLPRSLCTYNAAESGTEVMPEAMYLRKYAEVPGEYSYRMPYWRVVDDTGKQVREYQNSISFCNGCFITDFLMYNNKILLDSEFEEKIGMLNYDLSENTLCSNIHHGCQFKDDFGRYVKTFVLRKKRQLFERTIRLCHPKGIFLSLHAQNRYCPMLHGIGDVWDPGEENCAVLKDRPYALIDGTIDERLFRSEYNRDVIGVNVRMSCAIAQLNSKNHENAGAAIAAMTMMMLYDIDFSRLWMNYQEVCRLWDILARFDFRNASVEAHKFYRQREVLAGNDQVLVTWYACPQGKKLLVLGNRTTEPQTTVIDLNRLLPGNRTAREEMQRQDIAIVNGLFSATVPPRAFLLVSVSE
ncbi:MAG: hypothetical protein IJJ33_12055 [Victivallales bacterium]|nr:hypothetical protein [Victivallales bacterium]